MNHPPTLPSVLLSGARPPLNTMPTPTLFPRSTVMACSVFCLISGIGVGVLITRFKPPPLQPGPQIEDSFMPMQAQAHPSRYWSKIEVHLIDGKTLVFRSAYCEAAAHILEIHTYNREQAVVPMRQVRFYTVSEQQPEPMDEIPDLGLDELLAPATKS